MPKLKQALLWSFGLTKTFNPLCSQGRGNAAPLSVPHDTGCDGIDMFFAKKKVFFGDYFFFILLGCSGKGVPLQNDNRHYYNDHYYSLMKFYDREAEQQLLGEVLKQSKKEARMTVLMGRRRIGKTELSLRGGDDTVLYFFVGKKTEALLCQDFVQEIASKLGVPVPGQAHSFSEVFRFVLQLSENRAFTLIIDEFQNFQKVNPSIFSDMQRDWDLKKSTSHLNLIIIGSVFTLMKKISGDYEEPLFGRANERITLQPFKTGVLKEILHDFNPGYTPEDLPALFSITGGESLVCHPPARPGEDKLEEDARCPDGRKLSVHQRGQKHPDRRVRHRLRDLFLYPDLHRQRDEDRCGD